MKVNTRRRAVASKPQPHLERGSAEWIELVMDGRIAVQFESDGQWMLGDIALRVSPATGSHANDGSRKLLREYADEIGVALGTLLEYRRVADGWPEAERSSTVSFSAHRILLPLADRHDLISKQGMSARAARRIVQERNAEVAEDADRVDQLRRRLERDEAFLTEHAVELDLTRSQEARLQGLLAEAAAVCDDPNSTGWFVRATREQAEIELPWRLFSRPAEAKAYAFGLLDAGFDTAEAWQYFGPDDAPTKETTAAPTTEPADDGSKPAPTPAEPRNGPYSRFP